MRSVSKYRRGKLGFEERRVRLRLERVAAALPMQSEMPDIAKPGYGRSAR